MRQHASTRLSLLVWAVLLTGLLLAAAAAPGTLALHSADTKRARLERAIERDERAASAQQLGSRSSALGRRQGWH